MTFDYRRLRHLQSAADTRFLLWVLLIAAGLAGFARPAMALHIIPDRLDDPHFTAGPCPDIVPPDGAVCPNGATHCAAFYNPKLLPKGYNSVSYCANVPAGVGFQSPGFTMQTLPLNHAEQQAFLDAAKKVAAYVKDNVTVILEPYKVQYIQQSDNSVWFFFLGNEYYNPVCAADAFMPPFTDQAPTIVKNPDGSYSYAGLPETYTTVLKALQAKNARNPHPMALTSYLPSYSQINMEWPPSFYGWRRSTNMDTWNVRNFLVSPVQDYPITAGAKPFTLCGAPAVMKMLGFAALFNKNGHTINDINSPKYNMNVTLPGTDGAVVIPDLDPLAPYYTWIYNSALPEVRATQLPKAFFTKSADFSLGRNSGQWSCSTPTLCTFPQGVDPGYDLIGVFNHEFNHILGAMQSQYYKVSGEETALAYTYGTSLFLLDLFDIDADDAAAMTNYAAFTRARRNNNAYVPATVISQGPGDPPLTPWVQYTHQDHVIVYDVSGGPSKYFPLMNDSTYNPDGDIQFQSGWLYPGDGSQRLVMIDPLLANTDDLNVVHFNVQAAGGRSTIDYDTVREYSELASQGWNIDYSTLPTDTYSTRSPLADWYTRCFSSSTGAFNPNNDPTCTFSVP